LVSEEALKRQFQPLDKQRRVAQSRDRHRLRFSRNQAVGVLLFALVVLLYRLLRTPSGWLLPHGWWRW
jgi:hypothetical protein